MAITKRSTSAIRATLAAVFTTTAAVALTAPAQADVVYRFVTLSSTGELGVPTHETVEGEFVLSGASGKWDATSLRLERYMRRRSGLGRLP